MSVLKGITLLFVAVSLASCGGGDIAENEFVKQLPDDQKKAVVKRMNLMCDCASKTEVLSKFDLSAKDQLKKAEALVAAVESGDTVEIKAAKTAYDKSRETLDAVEDSEEFNKLNECLENIGKSLTEEESKAASTGDSKIRSLMKEQFKDDEEGFQKARENFMSFCPKMAKADKSQKIQFKAQGKVDSVEDKLKEMKIE